MGLDISNATIDNILSDISYYVEDYIKDKYQEELKDLLSDSNVEAFKASLSKEKLKKEQDADRTMQFFTSKIDLYNQIKDYIIPQEYIDLARKHEYILDDEEVTENSRMGNYGTIHYIRSFVYIVEQKGNESITKEEILEIISDISRNGRTIYGVDFYDNLCGHSDCGGIYIPFPDRTYTDDGETDYENGSSIGLLEELDHLAGTGCIDHLRNIIEEYNNNQYTSKEDEATADIAVTILWGYRKLLFHSVDSILEKSIIQFH